MSFAAHTLRCSPDEYLPLERKSDVKHEFWGGFVLERVRSSREYNLIAGNLGSEIRSRLRERPRETYVSNMRVCVDATGPYSYPDVVVVCGERQFLDAHVDTLLNPTVLVEVLSPSTEADDRGRKFAHYQRLPSLREYVMVSQDRVLVERDTRLGRD
jgi:Uma2 family endonuclease